ncbi:hypothetical protein QJS66_18070 [Kocuria rhizophila]|nr:hypothetical protein QJS66_18070 [Kocuria rhizophila]
MLEPASVREAVPLPDPWHKTRHHKRRLVSPGFAELAARVLEPGGLCAAGHGWQEYAVVMREVRTPQTPSRERSPWPAADDTARPSAGWARAGRRILTSFERKAAEAGRVPDLAPGVAARRRGMPGWAVGRLKPT